jgi:uncharacterized Rossmann fold enzyme
MTSYDTGCSCDGTCTDCAKEMRADLDAVLTILALHRNGDNLRNLAIVPGSAAARVADALVAKGDASV